MSETPGAQEAPAVAAPPETFIHDPQYLVDTVERIAPALDDMPADQRKLALTYVLARVSVQQLAEVLDRVLWEAERAASPEAVVAAVRPHLDLYRALAEQHGIPLAAPRPRPTSAAPEPPAAPITTSRWPQAGMYL